MTERLFRIPNCYDSHVHWLGTGEYESRLNLKKLKTESEALNLRVEPQHYRGDWLTGFGWDQNLWSENKFPVRQTLDRLSPNKPVASTRADGHAFWLNTEALSVSPKSEVRICPSGSSTPKSATARLKSPVIGQGFQFGST